MTFKVQTEGPPHIKTYVTTSLSLYIDLQMN